MSAWTLRNGLFLPAPTQGAESGNYASDCGVRPSPTLEEISATVAPLIAEREALDAEREALDAALDERQRETAARTGRTPGEIAALLSQLMGTPEECQASRDLGGAIGRLASQPAPGPGRCTGSA